MTIERDAQNTAFGFAEKMRDQILVWTKIVAAAQNSISIRLRRVAASKRKSNWVIFVLVVAGNILAFNYFQERITRYYLSVLLANLVRMNEDVDALDAKIGQLNKKTDDLGAKLGNPAQPSLSPPSNSPKPRRR